MALNDTQVRQLRAKLEAKHVKTRKANGADLHYVEGWHVIAEANRIFGYAPGIAERSQATVCGVEKVAPIMARLTLPRSASASEPEIPRLCGRDQGLVKAKPLPPGRLTTSRLKAPRQMQRSARLLRSATPSVLPFMTASRLASEKLEASQPPW